MERKHTYKPRTRSEISAWLERARQRKAVWEKKMQEIFASEEKQKKFAVESHYYDIETA